MRWYRKTYTQQKKCLKMAKLTILNKKDLNEFTLLEEIKRIDNLPNWMRNEMLPRREEAVRLLKKLRAGEIKKTVG